MPKCAAIGCDNTNDRERASDRQLELQDKVRLSFHNFPKDPIRQKAWIAAMQLGDWQPKKGSYLCSMHFDENFFDRTSANKNRLKNNAIPHRISLMKRKFPDDSSEALDNNISKFHKQDCPANVIKDIQNNDTNDGCCTNPAKISIDRSTSISPERFVEQSRTRATVDRATSVSPSTIFNSPTKQRIRESNKAAIDFYQKKVKSLQAKLRSIDKKNAHMQNILKSIEEQKLVTDTELEILHSLGKSNEHLLARQFNKAKNLSVSKQYSPELRTFALTLHYYSPKAYAYVREQFNTCLPHPKTICKWYKSVNGDPGLNTEALECIKQRVSLRQHLLLGALIFDEMSIRQQIEYDGHRYYGYVDLGNEIESDNSDVAKDALVFLVNCINDNWKIPIAYFLINGMTSESKCNLIRQCLSALHDSGVRIVTLTFDGAPANISAAKALGCSFQDKNNLQTWFPHPVTDDAVYVFFDPSHMEKLVRNILGNKKSIVNKENEFILWNYFVELHELQQAEGLHLGNKLRTAHIHFHKQKMKVRLATQTLSKSVADSFQICRDDLQLSQFKDCGATMEFIRLFNDLFDLLNSRNLKEPGFKKPLNIKNKDQIFQKLDTIENYILGLKTAKDSSAIVDSRQCTGFLGFLICIKSLRELYTSICENSKLLAFIPTYKLSQDHLEMFFACIRSCGGHNNNPNTKQFRAAMKRLLVHTELKAVSGNCTPLENIAILHFTSNTRLSPVDTINNSTPMTRVCESDFEKELDVIDIHSYLPDFRNITEFSSRIVAYIAGFIIRSLLKSLCCQKCIEAIIVDEKDRSRDHSLIYQKSLGGLIYPSPDVIYICKMSERKIRFALHQSGANVSGSKFHGDIMVNSILNEFIGVDSLFSELEDHSLEQDAIYNHRVHLIRAIVEKYVKTRLFYIGKNMITNVSDRQKFNKLLLFKGQ